MNAKLLFWSVTVALAGFSLAATDIWLINLAQGARTRLTFDDSVKSPDT